MNTIPKLVFSKTLSEPLSWETATLASGGLVEEVSALKEQPGKEIALAGSVNPSPDARQRRLPGVCAPLWSDALPSSKPRRWWRSRPMPTRPRARQRDGDGIRGWAAGRRQI